jgi:putative serine/threonine protein kinase
MVESKLVTPETAVSLEDLAVKPYSTVIAYPVPDAVSVRCRIDQLAKLEVDSIIFSGRSSINGLSVLGKGCVGVVVEGQLRDGTRVALKIRRTDANRPSMMAEAKFHRKANAEGVGPSLLGESSDVLSMMLVRGWTLPAWASVLSGRVDHVAPILRVLLEQCFTLDRIGLDHGELSHAHKNVLVTQDYPVIIDFESASLKRKPSNVTSIVQYLFIAGGVSHIFREVTSCEDEKRLIESLTRYKRNISREGFERVLPVLGL